MPSGVTLLTANADRCDECLKIRLRKTEKKNENGNVFSVVNMVNNPNHTWILLACTGNCNGSITDCTSKNPNLLGACNCPGDNHCFGVNGIVFGLSTYISIEK